MLLSEWAPFMERRWGCPTEMVFPAAGSKSLSLVLNAVVYDISSGAHVVHNIKVAVSISQLISGKIGPIRQMKG